MRNLPTLLFTAFILLLGVRSLSAQNITTTAPALSLAPGSRVIKNFDFEETAQGNFESIPMFWSKVVGRGFPAYASGRFDHEIFRSPNPTPTPDDPGSSFRLDIDGGSAAYRYVPPANGVIPVNSNADYFILGFVKTAGLHHARAVISAWFADGTGELLPATKMLSDPYAAALGEAPNAWHVVYLYMPGPPPGTDSPAKSLVLQLGLMQPQQLSSQPPRRFALYQQDIKGTAWFDDVMVFQLPRIGVEVPAGISGNIFGPGEQVQLDLTLADLAPTAAAAKPLHAALRIADPDGLIFATESWDVAPHPDEPWIHHYTHPPLPPGLYTATLDISDGSSLVARRETRFLSMAANPGAAATDVALPPAPEFGLVTDQWPVPLWNDIPPILRLTGVGVVEIAAWRKDMSDQALLEQDKHFDALLASISRLGVHSIAAFAEMPAVLSAKLADAPHSVSTGPRPPSSSLLALLDADLSIWRPYVSFLLAHYATRVDLWELGSGRNPFSGSLADQAGPQPPVDRYPDLYKKTFTELTGLVNHPQLVIPWNALFDFNRQQYPGAILDLCIPASIRPSQIPSYIDNLQQGGPPTTRPSAGPSAAPDILAHIEPLEDPAYSRIDRLADFAQRIVYARSANPLATLIDLPLSRRTTLGSFTAHTQPEELLLVYRTLVHALGNHDYIRELPLAPGLKAFLFEREGAASVILWNESGDTSSLPVDLQLGSAPRLITLDGTAAPLSVNSAGLTHLDVTSLPIIIDHADAPLIELRASFALATAHFPAGAGTIQTQLLLTNSYSAGLTGTLRLIPPRGWSVDPPSITVSLSPGATLRQNILVRYPYSESVGPKTFAGHLKVESGSATGINDLDLSVPISVASDTVEMEAFTELMPNGDLVVNQMITNISASPINAQAYALVPGYARQQRFVVDLQPTQTTIKRFLFPIAAWVSATPDTKPADIAAAISGKVASLGLRQSNGRTLISKLLTLQ